MKIPMPSVPISDLLTHSLPQGSFVLCGGQNTRVSWARSVTLNTLDSAAPDDLILIDINTLGQNQDVGRNLARIIGRLVTAHIQAIGIQGDVNISALENAARNSMTVIYLPEETAIDNIERAVCRYIIDLQNELEKQDAVLQQELARTANNNFGIDNVLRLLAQKTGFPAILHDAHLYRLSFASPETLTTIGARWNQQWHLLNDRSLVAHFAEQSTVHQHNSSIMESDSSVTISITVDNSIAGYLSLLKDSNTTLDDFSSIALSRSAAVLGILLAKGNIMHNDRHPRIDWITSWLDSSPNDDPIISARAEQHAYLPDQVYVISTLRWLPGYGQRRATKVVKPEQITEQARQETTARRISAIVGQYRDRTVLFLPLEKAQHTGRMRQYMVTIADRLSELFSGTVVCGVGRPAVGLTDLRTSFKEAERAMNLSDQLLAGANTHFFGDLSLSALLMNVQPYEEIYQFCTDWLSSILGYDQQNNSDLLLTMSVYFANNGNMAATAKQLNVHRNTLVYRLNRIAEITQLDMDDADVQLNLHLAIKAYGLLQQLELNS